MEERERIIQERLAVLQRLQAEAETVQREIIRMELLVSEFERTIETLEYFDSVEGEPEALMNIGGGVFAYVDVKNSKKFLVDVGAGVYIEKDVKDAIESVKRKKERIEENVQKLTTLLQQIVNQAARIQEELARLAKEEEKRE